MLGVLYVAVGAIYLTGYASKLMASIGPSLSRLSTVKGSAALAVNAAVARKVIVREWWLGIMRRIVFNTVIAQERLPISMS